MDYAVIVVLQVLVAIAWLVLMSVGGASWSFPPKGIMFALLAGTLGAFGAFFVLSAMGSVGTRPWMIPVVMSVVFAGAPIVNAIVALVIHPPKQGWGSIHPMFWIGILVAAMGAAMVTYYKPGPKKPGEDAAKPAPAQVEQASAERATEAAGGIDPVMSKSETETDAAS